MDQLKAPLESQMRFAFQILSESWRRMTTEYPARERRCGADAAIGVTHRAARSSQHDARSVHGERAAWGCRPRGPAGQRTQHLRELRPGRLEARSWSLHPGLDFPRSPGAYGKARRKREVATPPPSSRPRGSRAPAPREGVDFQGLLHPFPSPPLSAPHTTQQWRVGMPGPRWGGFFPLWVNIADVIDTPEWKRRPSPFRSS